MQRYARHPSSFQQHYEQLSFVLQALRGDLSNRTLTKVNARSPSVPQDGRVIGADCVAD